MRELAGCLDPCVDRESKCEDRKSKCEDRKPEWESRQMKELAGCLDPCVDREGRGVSWPATVSQLSTPAVNVNRGNQKSHKNSDQKVSKR